MSRYLMTGLVAVACAVPLMEGRRALAELPADELTMYRARQQVHRAAAERIAPCVVTLETVGGSQPSGATGPGTQPAGPPQGARFIVADGPTTGLIYHEDGLIISSAFNFVRDPSLITVTLADGRRFVGELLARDEVRRLAMVRIEATGLPAPEWVESTEAIRVGQTALALGRGLGGTAPSMSVGLVSGLNRQSGLAIQTDALLSPTNFGGPLVDIDGRVLGLCVPMGMGTGFMSGVEWYDSGIGFAIPYRELADSAESLAVGHNLRRGLLGVRIDPRETPGALVVGIARPSPAQRAGMRVGDVIIGIEGAPVSDYAELRRVMVGRYAGRRTAIRVRRGQDEVELSLVLAVPEDIGEVPDAPDVPTPAPDEEEGMSELPSSDGD